MEETTEIKYALRHLRTGVFARLHTESNIGKDFCGEETCSLTIRDYELDLPRFEVDSLYKLLSVTSRDEQWYNTSRDRPCWNGLKMDEFELVAIETALEFDDLGGDPVSRRERTFALTLPPRYSGVAYRTQQPSKPEKLVELFGPAGDLDEDAWPVVAIVKPDAGEDIQGMLFNEFDVGRGIVTATIPLPARWPIDPGRPIDRKDPGFRLALIESAALRTEELPVEFLSKEEQSVASGPRP